MTLTKLFAKKANELACKIAQSRGFDIVKSENGKEPYIQLLEKGAQHTVVSLGKVVSTARKGAKVQVQELQNLLDNPNGLPAKMAMFARMALMQAAPQQPEMKPIPLVAQSNKRKTTSGRF